MNVAPTKREMARAMQAGDASYDGVFFTGVKTTGVFCRPSCKARKPRPENVEYFAKSREALLAGYRACKRCRPMETDGTSPVWVRKLFAAVEAAPGGRLRDADLRGMKIEPSRARRYFNEHYGMTFQAYHRSRRVGMALASMRQGTNVLDTGLSQGFSSASGFRSAFERTFGKPPKAGAQVKAMVAAELTSPIGPLLCAASDEGICLLEFADRRALETQIDVLRKRMKTTVVLGRNAYIDKLSAELDRYWQGKLDAFTVPLVIRGTAFQEKVWRGLLEIPFGETESYEGLARKVGHAGAQRAVGTANGNNRMAIVIPCHRVVNKGGKIGGYGGGLWRKRFLLDLEQSAARRR